MTIAIFVLVLGALFLTWRLKLLRRCELFRLATPRAKWQRVTRSGKRIWIPACERRDKDTLEYTQADRIRSKKKASRMAWSLTSFHWYRKWKGGDWYCPTRSGVLRYMREHELREGEHGCLFDGHPSKRRRHKKKLKTA